MSMKKGVLVGIALLVGISTGCHSRNVSVSETRYLKNNIHAQSDPDEIKASYANWTRPGGGHVIIPVNTPVKFGSYRKGLSILPLDGDRKINFELNTGQMGLEPDQYIALISAPTPVSLAGLSDLDRKGITEGAALIGMSKDGVRIALGYPAAHKTPSLQSNNWIYWKNRFNTIAVEFDENGKVKNIRD
jgi:hypothetical protein